METLAAPSTLGTEKLSATVLQGKHSNYDTDIFMPFFVKIEQLTGAREYRGKLGKKAELLDRARFCICFENSRGSPGYVTEKIFDCFTSGCVPASK